ncbi:hypothetical protein RIF25_07950 [Thermosynechococcaceae cyanobacterium BACA0444]|uniref:Uncharacterized protein n=1 Tax=Pseudocalidococcus azoricus BACA0444 TaxID=2918990 RepID=A0AAE4JVV1_9CYAN|nr:hypothetical protein [Pseudocalidococcus azoricus]MDS3860745.1 hypothetical protein [Pseudocalidococcus azoricus BACA0444]
MTISEAWHGAALGIAGSGLWAIALYLGFYPIGQKIIERLETWLGKAKSSQAEFWAAMTGVLPFVLLGVGLFYGITVSLGLSWSVSLGIMATIGGGVYELGRRDGEINRE